MMGLSADNVEGSHILIVDDEAHNTLLLKTILKKENYRCSIAQNAEETFMAISQETPDMILLDIMMPDIDGFEVCQRLKADPDTSHIPVIFVSVSNESEQVIKGFEIGAVDYITKPFHPKEVLARVKTHLQLKHSLDIIDQYNRQLEQMLERRTEDLIRTERQAAFGQMIQGIVHNLRSPLSVMSMGVEFLELICEKVYKILKETPYNIQPVFKQLDEGHETLAGIGQSLSRMNQIVAQLMSKSRSDQAEKIELIDLNTILKREMEFFKADKFFNLALQSIDYSNHSLWIKVIPAELSQVIGNLVRNALDALHEVSKPRIYIESGWSMDRVWVAIRDNGPGIPENHLEHIFDPFFTTKPPASEQKDNEPVGTGLGLYYCKKTVELYNGTIKVDTSAEKGTVFTIELPYQKTEFN